MTGEADEGSGGLTILHLSDIHLGAYHAFRTAESDPRLAEVSLADAIGADLEHTGTDVDALVISGDLVTHGKWIELRLTAHEVLTALCGRLGLPKDRVYIVPGNHDYQWYELDARGRMLRKILEKGKAPESLRLGHEVQFDHFMEEFYEAKRSCWGEVSTIESDGFRLKIGLLDSCRITPVGFREYGCLTLAQIKHLKANFDRDVRGPEIRVVVLHHHITPVLPSEPPSDDARVSVTLDAGQLIDTLLAAEVGLVMHGHQHYPGLGRISKSRFVGRDPHPLPERNLYVLSAGSAGANATERWPDVPNTYTLVRVTAGSAVVDVRSLSPRGDESSLLFHANMPVHLHRS